MQPSKPTFLDVFSGCGGLSLGMFRAGWQGLFAIEKNPDAFSTLKHNLISPKVTRYTFDWPEWLAQKHMEVSELLKNHRDELISLRGNVDLIAGGPPCQGFSTAGKRDPDDPRNSLTEEYIQLVSIVRPRFLLIENVRGFNAAFKARSKTPTTGIPYSRLVRERLECLDYSVYSSMVCCSDFGVPQYRKRFIMLAIKNDDTILQVLGNKSPIDLLLKKAQEFRTGKGLPSAIDISVSAAISDLETTSHELVPHTGFKGFSQVRYIEPEGLSEYQELMRDGMEGEAPNSMRLARHTEPVTKRFKEIQAFASLGRCLSPADRKILGIKKHSITPLHPGLPSSTVTTLPDDILHYSEPRILTVRENARLQSFPDWFEFQGKYTTGGKKRKHECPRYTQVGNAVPPLLAEAIGTLLLKLIDRSRAASYKFSKEDLILILNQQIDRENQVIA
jgi:DNA (cytosine-5)-methyltransferase 1